MGQVRGGRISAEWSFWEVGVNFWRLCQLVPITPKQEAPDCWRFPRWNAFLHSTYITWKPFHYHLKIAQKFPPHCITNSKSKFRFPSPRLTPTYHHKVPTLFCSSMSETRQRCLGINTGWLIKWWSGEMAILKIGVGMHFTLSTQALSGFTYGTTK